VTPLRPTARRRLRPRRPAAVLFVSLLVITTLAGVSRPVLAAASSVLQARFRIPASARELIVVSSPTYDPPGYLASFRTFARASASSPWKLVSGPWQAETGRGHSSQPGARVTAQHLLGLLDRSDDLRQLRQPGRPARPFTTVSCAVTGGTRTVLEPVQPVRARAVRDDAAVRIVIRGSVDRLQRLRLLRRDRLQPRPDHRGPNAPGSGIFLHAWENGPTHGCVALPLPISCWCCDGSILPSVPSSRSGALPRSPRAAAVLRRPPPFSGARHRFQRLALGADHAPSGTACRQRPVPDAAD